MTDTDPIEIELLINSPEVIKQAAQVDAALNGLDSSVGTTEAKFKQYIESQIKATKRSDNLEKSLKKNDKIINKHGKSLKNEKRQFDSLGNSINQLTRELPAFTFSAQTGFAAISNNLPMLADEISKLKQKNDALKASGKKGVPIWKQLAQSFFSWNTLMSVGITLFTVYGKEIADFLSSLVNGKKEFNNLKESVKALNTAFKSVDYSNARAEVVKMTSKIRLAKEGKLSAIRVLNEYNKGLGKVIGSVKSLDKAESVLIEKKDAYVKMMLYKSAASAFLQSSNEIIIDLVKKENKLKDQLKGAKETVEKWRNTPTKQNVIKDENGKIVGFYSDLAESHLKGAKKAVKKIQESEKKLEQQQTDFYKTLLGKAAKIAQDNQLKFYKDDYKSPIKTIDNRKNLLQKIAALDSEYSRKQLTKDKQEIQALKDKFSKVRKLVVDFNKKNKVKIELVSLDRLQKKAEQTLLYRQGTKKLVKELEKEQQIFAFYQAFKTKTSKQEADKRYKLALKGFENYGDLLKSEYKKLQSKLKGKQVSEVTGAEKERLFVLDEKIAKFKENQNKSQIDKFTEAYNSSISHNEKLFQIEKEFTKKSKQLNKITNQDLKRAKQKVLEEQKAKAIDTANTEAYAKKAIFIKLSDDLLSLTKRDLKIKIRSLEEYLEKSKNSITKEQKQKIQAEIKQAKALGRSSAIQLKQKALQIQKEAILKRIITLQKKGIKNIEDEKKALESVNKNISNIKAEKLGKIADKANQIGGGLQALAGDIAPFNQALADTLQTAGDALNIVGDLANSAASFYSWDIVGGITGAMSAVGGLLKMSEKVRESERRSREELRKWQEQIYVAQLNYNAEQRKRLSREIKINDAYKSRIANIKEEIALNKQKKEQINKESQSIFKRLLKAKTITNKQTYKTGGFLGFWKKTKVREIKKSLAEVLGFYKVVSSSTSPIFSGKKIKINTDVKLTDELFEKLEKINSEKPLTGDAKTAYEQLKKLRDEYGTIAEADRQAKQNLKNEATGTTAKALADSIKEGILSGKKSFADFAKDIEKFLSDAIISGMSAKVIEPQMQKLQDQLYNYLGDGVLTAEEKEQFQNMYLKIAKEAKQYMDLINQSGIKIGDTIDASNNSLQGALKGMTEDQVDLLAGQFGGLRLTQLETNKILTDNHLKHLEQISQSIEIQMDIEYNTARTAGSTERIEKLLKKAITKKNNTAKANGITIP